ncbi:MULTISPECIES: MFS transporter [Micrococcaceae]|uniref:MFS transporter n=1 Tax=Micrococcaceae TaxID=1268 RepID=UPI0012F0B9B5|nr:MULTISPECIES: MFS transporter [unclassified Arthrobacter]MDE8588861.1 MFS transporter [Arthrobacter sp. NQ4]BCW80664.1 MFS transporter [Arthrobacter sp. NicSoilC5]VXA99424.1 MFS transporter [Arthrobacter sp. 8AJ]
MTHIAAGAQAQSTPEAQRQLKRARKAALAAFLGGALEYYDFFIYATAASLVFSKIFFPAGDPTVALIASFATFGVAYVARPFGAVVFGHLGDKIGRKNTLVLTLVLMGSATFLIGALPDFNAAGYWAPALLVVLRLMQGLSAGAETAGASALSTEEAPEGRRGFFASFAMSGISAGIVLASLAFLPVAAMSEADRLAWGWRIPFWLSLVVLIVAYLVRRSLEEPEVFEEKHDHGELVKLPFAKMFQTHPAQFFQVALMSFETVTNTFMQSFGLAYAVSVGVPASTMLWVSILGNVLAIASQPLMARWSDSFGRRPIFISGVLGSGAMIFVYFWVISTGNIPMIFLTSTLITAGTYSMSNAIYPAWFSELFNVKVRYSGMAIGLQVGILCAGFTPLLGTALVGADKANWGPAAWIVAGSSILAVAGAWWARETAKTPLRELGNHVK